MLEENTKLVGIKFVYVNESYTSKTCSAYGTKNIVRG